MAVLLTGMFCLGNSLLLGQSNSNVINLVYLGVKRAETEVEVNAFLSINVKSDPNTMIKKTPSSYDKNAAQITTKLGAAGIKSDSNPMIPQALMLNELLTKACKYAFKGRQTETVWCLKQSKNYCFDGY